ncbi:TetR/AcrR family transcriptional regulator [Nocardia jiangxiensis]|uniref:TetR/AcrR family transcriptional regulator n=1 Tax=Nocardia jiangxiensis TaxID=282685 RepID=A0ABW6SED0_9NOCA|nr:TetR family transcriptional regulator [Nocardia jiangxiensis]
MARSAEETRQKILDAAMEEFARYGIAGARVDRITKNAGVNNALLYRYFGSKLDLFDTVFSRLIEDTVDDVPMDARNLPGYVGALFDYYASHPEVVRLTAWRQLEHPSHPMPEALHESVKQKTERILEAQESGDLASTLPPDELLTVIIHLSLVCTPLSPMIDPAADPERRRATAVETVRALLDG